MADDDKERNATVKKLFHEAMDEWWTKKEKERADAAAAAAKDKPSGFLDALFGTGK